MNSVRLKFIWPRKWSLLAVAWFCAVGSTYAADGPQPAGARAWGMGNASVTITDRFALFNNQAALAGLTQATVFTTFDTRYGLDGLNTFRIGLVKNLRKNWTAGASITRFGDKLYSETSIGLAAAHTVGKISLGAKVSYFQVLFGTLNISRKTAVVELGALAQITPALTFGMHLYNLNQAQLFDYQRERVPTVMKMGLSYRPISKLLLAAEIEKDIDFAARFKAGLDYEIIPHVFVRTGFCTKPSTNHVGFGFSSRNLTFDYALHTHPQLGLSHHVSLSYDLGGKVQ